VNFMNRTETPKSILATNELTASEKQSNADSLPNKAAPDHHSPPTEETALFPIETEIYILPDGRVIFADLPAEMADLASQLGSMEPSAVELDDSLDDASVPNNASIPTHISNPEFSQPTEES
jgi:hypothetical protein